MATTRGRLIDNIEHAELYSREAEQEVMAGMAMEPLMNWRRPKPG